MYEISWSIKFASILWNPVKYNETELIKSFEMQQNEIQWYCPMQSYEIQWNPIKFDNKQCSLSPWNYFDDGDKEYVSQTTVRYWQTQ